MAVEMLEEFHSEARQRSLKAHSESIEQLHGVISKAVEILQRANITAQQIPHKGYGELKEQLYGMKGKAVEMLHNIRIGIRTFREFFADNGIGTVPRYDANLALTKRIKYLHYEVQCSDDESVFILAEDGWPISKRRLQRMRLALGLRQRIPGADREQTEALMVEKLAYEMEHGQIEDLGKHDMYRFMRSKYNIIGRITGRSQVSVLTQYVATAAHKGVIPFVIRSDRGAETTLAAAAHWALSSAARTKPDGTPITLNDAFRHGTSKENVSIEMWWNQQTRSMLGRWRQYFENLSNTDQYVGERLAHRLAFLAVYIPIIRNESLEFVKTWNHHRIRRQKDEHIVHGRPYQLYNYPSQSGGVDCGVPVGQMLLAAIMNDVLGFGTYPFTTTSFLQWCDTALRDLGFESLDGREFTADRQKRLHALAYGQLRDAIQAHLDAGNAADLSECPRPPSPEQFYRANEPLRDAFANLREANVAAGNPLDLDMDYVAFREPDANDEALNVEERAYIRLRSEQLHHANEDENHNVHPARQQEIYHQIGQAEDQEQVAVLWQELREMQ
ncbi:hypothetical protein LTR95_010397 [Oleoguttula sp. CCFEE 5521]